MSFAPPQVLVELVRRHKVGEPVGICSVCSANPFVIQAAMQQADRDGTYVLIEATCNQVNQFGGYSGMTPLDFAQLIRDIAARLGFAEERILLGGDHLGPFPWQKLPVEEAISNAAGMVQAYAQAGFGKLHLDASMACMGDNQDGPLAPALIAYRSALLCAIAEAAVGAGAAAPVYVVGTDIPTPGGALEADLAMQITTPQQIQMSLEALRQAFERRALSEAWDRVIAVVVQPGVEFGDEGVHEYDRQAAAALSRFIEGQPHLIYEAHSTDYQRPECLRALVQDHFAILKVGPGLTFAMREAIFALARMETEWLGGRADVQLSNLIEIVDRAMLRNPIYWRSYYRGDELQTALARKYSRSDRIRYYWSDPEVMDAVERLLANLKNNPPPLTLLSQCLPVQYERVRAALLENQPDALIRDYIMDVLDGYASACRSSSS